jgi:hypothetical protein
MRCNDADLLAAGGWSKAREIAPDPPENRQLAYET